MSEYSGLITLSQLINPQPGGQAGKGIEKITTYYAVSLNGSEPPSGGSLVVTIDKEKMEIRDQEGNIILDVNTENKVEVLNDKFFYVEGETLQILQDIWTRVIPSEIKGYYLWTKMVVTYTTGEEDEVFTVNYIGQDANGYLVETNEEEILVFASNLGENDRIFTPYELTFKVYNLPKSASSEQIILTELDYTIEYAQNQAFYKVPSEYLKFGTTLEDEDQSVIVIDEKTIYFNVSKFFSDNNLEGNQVFRFRYLINDEVAAQKIITSRNGVHDDMARFSLNAADITASIQSGKLKFNESGLSLYKDEERVFYLGSYGEALFKGSVYATNGIFSGELSAATGSFSGSVEATSGKIGGFVLENDMLYSTAQGGNREYSVLKLNGAEGTIYAKDITIGSGAIIEDYISLGQAKILNPNKYDNLILETGEIKITQNGILNIGNILINGGNETNVSFISASDASGSNGWRINGDGTAQFNEIIANKATIQNSVMEVGSVQAVGSLMLFKDSWKILSVNGNICKLDLTLTDNNGVIIAPPLEENDYVLVNGIHYKIQAVDTFTHDLTLDKPCSFSKGDVLTKIGKEEDCLITIQGDSNQTFSQSTKNSLTLSSFYLLSNDTSEPTPTYTKKLVLGELNDIEGASGIGLYAENVFLNGTLTTKVGEGNYAGVNTISGARASKFGETDQSKIVFWAGSDSTDQKSIESAKFQVTENGSIYASQGVFEGSIITKSVIKGASLHTTKIYGEDENGSGAALKIYDASNGILFMKTKEDDSEALLKINNNGLYKESLSFINLEDDIRFLGNQISLIGDNSQSIFTSNKLEFENSNKLGSLSFDSGFEFNIGSSKIIGLEEGGFTAKVNTNLQRNLLIGVEGQNGTLDYQKVDNYGYNLYVR